MAPARLTFAGPPTRLDRYLRDELGPEFGRRRVAMLLADGNVRVNGRRATKSTLLRAGDEIAVAATALANDVLRPLPAPLTIVHVDAELVAVDKPPGVPSVAGKSGGPSVAAALLDRFPEMGAVDPRRAAGLVHRLDTGTSGLLVAARTVAAFRHLRAAFAAKRIAKEYLAIAVGRMVAPGRVDLPLTRRPRRRARMIVAPPGSGWQATTEYRPLASTGDHTLVHLRMRTGVTHQLRVHLAHLGHPVLGDPRYGSRHDRDAAAPWHYLHALRMSSEDGTLGDLETAFPRHWLALVAELGWSPDAPAW